jgi:hypothetical protein
MTRAFAVVFVMTALLANPAAAQRSGRGSNMEFAAHPGLFHSGFIAAYPTYPCPYYRYHPPYPVDAAPPWSPRPERSSFLPTI